LTFDIRDGVSMEEIIQRINRDLPNVMKSFNGTFKEMLWQLTQNLRRETRLLARNTQLCKFAKRNHLEIQACPMPKKDSAAAHVM
jgi:hypothetical protein